MSSKIKVDTIENVAGSGNVSLGSGHNLVVPGNITGQGTAAITSNATVGGTLGVTSNTTVGGTLGVTGKTTLSDNVGIGVTTETDWHSNNDVLQLGLGACIYGNNTATENQILANAKGTLGSSLNGYKYINADKASTYQQYDGQHNFRVAGAGSADAAITWNTAMTIDNSGRVIKPLTPAFRASRTGGNYSGSSTEVIVWNNVIYNQGSHYDNSNGRFTAPVAGVYQFNVMGSVTGGPQNAAMHRASINGSYQADVFPISTSSASHISYANSFLLNLSANDYVQIWSPGASVTWYGTGNVHNHFSGFLIG